MWALKPYYLGPWTLTVLRAVARATGSSSCSLWAGMGGVVVHGGDGGCGGSTRSPAAAVAAAAAAQQEQKFQ